MTDIRAGLAANLRTVPSARQVSEYRLDNPTPPTLQVTGLDEIEATTFGDTGFVAIVVVQGFAGTPVDRAAQELLDKWIWPTGTDSVWRAILSDRTLGGLLDTAQLDLISNDGHQIFQVAGKDVLGSTWRAQIQL